MNRLPSANLSGPGEATAGDRVKFTGSGDDPDGSVVEINFDLDGDGLFEYTADASDEGDATVEKLFDQAGSYNIGVRVIDDRGGVGYDNQLLKVKAKPASQGSQTTAPPVTPAEVKPVAADDTLFSFKLSAPVFGGRKGVALVARYRLRKAARVEVGLYRGTGKKIRRVKTVDRGTRRAGRPYRVKVPSRGRSRGMYTVRLRVTPSDGSARRIYKLVARRL
jgi:hypothetical protein